MILVTGGLGFLGSHIALSLMAQGWEVILVDNMANASLQTLERLEYISGMYVPFVKVDVRNTPALNKVFEQYSVDAVIHAAGFKSLEESRLKPLEYYNDNVSCIMSLLRSMQRMGVRRLIHLSSLAIYGKNGSTLSEDEVFNFTYDNPYIKSQQMMEEIIRDTIKTDDEWRVIILRLSNVVGAFEHGVLGENVVQLPKNIVPLALQVAAMQRDFLELHKNVATRDKTAERSFVHVLDVCEAIFLSLYHLTKQQNHCENFNIAQTHLTSIGSLIHVISNVTQAPIETRDAFYRNDELVQLGADVSKAERLLNWKPKRSLEKMIEDEWLFYQNTLKGS